MTVNIKKIVIALLLISIAGIWLYFWRSEKTVNFTINNQPLLAINYVSIVNTNKDKSLEDKEIMRIASKVFAFENPEIKKVGVTLDGSYGQFADYNLFIASDRDQFFTIAKIEDTAKESNNHISAILEDKENRKFTTINPNQNYSIYLNFDNTFSFQPDSVIINNLTYHLERRENFYIVSNFQSGDATSVGIKTTDVRSKVTDAIFITGALKLDNPLNRIYDQSQAHLTQNKTWLSVVIPENSGLLLEPTRQVRLSSTKVVQSSPSVTNIFQYSHPYPLTYPLIDTNNPAFTVVLSSPAEYKITDVHAERRLLTAVYFSFLSLTIIFLLMLIPQIWETRDFAFSLIRERLTDFCRRNISELLLYTFIIIGLLILRLNPMAGEFLTTTSLSIVVAIFVLLALRFSYKYLLPILISLITVVAIAEELDFFNIAEKGGKLLFGIMFVILVVILLMKDTNRKKIRNDKNKRKN